MFGQELILMFIVLGIMALISFIIGLKNWVHDIKDEQGVDSNGC